MSYNHTTRIYCVVTTLTCTLEKAQKKRSEILVKKVVGDETIISGFSRYSYSEIVYTV